MRRTVALITLFLIANIFNLSAQYMFDYEDIKGGRFAVKTVSGVRSMNDGEHYTVITEGNKVDKYRYSSGDFVSRVFDAAEHPEMGGGFNDYKFSADERQIMFVTNKKQIYRRSFTADHWVYNIESGSLKKVTSEGGEKVATFSPDGVHVGYVRDNDIYLTVPGSDQSTAITTDGKYNEIINGHTDWVYEEEFAFTRAFEFSADGSQIAYLRFDEREVPEFMITRFTGEINPKPLVFKYPRVGETNSTVEVWLHSVKDGGRTKVDVGDNTDQYISRIGWAPSGNLFMYRTNRHQNHFELLLSNSEGETRVIYEEKDPRYVERLSDETITFLPGGDEFIVMNETSRNTHLYLYSASKGVQDTLTRGNWDVTKLVAVDSNRAYYLSTEDSPLRRSLYSVRFNGRGKRKLTEEEGMFSIAPSNGFKYFISYFSNVDTPNLVRLHNSSGKVIRVLEDNAELKKTIESRRVQKKEFFTLSNGQGAILNGYMIKPYDFSPDKKYPVMMTQYSGPGSQQVLDRWTMDWTDVLVQEGYIVVCVDGRGTGGRGTEFKKCTYERLGALEAQDQIAAAKHLATLPYVDMNRIGIQGWSYGGFMALNCIFKGADIFKMAIAVAPVTSWRYYDTIYTEIYNGLPDENPRGYDDNSPVNFAHLLEGKLMIIHGTQDDNVHVQNTFAMTDALVKADKKFDMMIYSDDNHSMSPTGRGHIYQVMIDYTLENL